MAEIEDFLEGFNQPTYRGMRINDQRVATWSSRDGWSGDSRPDAEWTGHKRTAFENTRLSQYSALRIFIPSSFIESALRSPSLTRSSTASVKVGRLADGLSGKRVSFGDPPCTIALLTP